MRSAKFTLGVKAQDGQDGQPGAAGTPGTRYQRAYKSTNSGTAPAASQRPTATTLNGWSDSPTQLTTTARYRWRCERSTGDTGAWGDWSSPALDGYLPQDGTSISVVGRAIAVLDDEDTERDIDGSIASDLEYMGIVEDSSIIQQGDVVLFQNLQSDKAFFDSRGVFTDDQDPATAGDCYIDLSGHLWMRRSTNAAPWWRDCGQIRGDDGQNAVQYEIRLQRSTLSVTPSGLIRGSVAFQVVKHDGQQETYLDDSVGNVEMRLVGSSWTGNWASAGYSSDDSCFDDDGLGGGDDDKRWNAYPNATQHSPVTLELRFTLDSQERATLHVPYTIAGQMSRNLYFAGIWTSFAGSFVVTDYRAPYFQLGTGSGKTFWAFVGDNGTWTQAKAGTPSAANANWRQMTDEFQYLITRAVFTDFAQLGSAIFNGDYMFSQHGYMLGFDGARTDIADGTCYQHVDPEDMFGRSFPDYFNSRATTQLVTASSYTAIRFFAGSDTWPTAVNSMAVTGGTYYSVKLRGEGVDWQVVNAQNSVLASGTLSTLATVVKNILIAADATIRLRCKANALGDTSSVQMAEVAQAKFVPNYAVNFRTGEGQQERLTLFGRVMSRRTEITSDNYAEHTTVVTLGSNDIEYIDPMKCSNFIVVKSLPTSAAGQVCLPALIGGNPTFNERVREMVGTRLVIYNKTGAALYVGTWSTTKQTIGNFKLQDGEMVYMELEAQAKSGTVDGTSGTQWENWNWKSLAIAESVWLL